MGWVQSLFDSGLKEVQCQVKKQRERWEAIPRGGFGEMQWSQNTAIQPFLDNQGRWHWDQCPKLDKYPASFQSLLYVSATVTFLECSQGRWYRESGIYARSLGWAKKCTPSKMPTSWSPEPVPMFPYIAKGLCWCDLVKDLQMGTYPALFGWPNVTTRVLLRETGRSERAVMTEAEVRMIWPISKEHLYFSKIRPISDFWPPDL